MPYIAFASAKGSPGVTTTLAAMAAAWPADRDLLVVEADPSGGDLAVRFDLAAEPSLVSLAAAGRRNMSVDTLLAHTQSLVSLSGQTSQPPAKHGSASNGAERSLGRRALVGPVSSHQATAALVSLGRRLSGVLRDAPLDVLVDCGRLDPSSPTLQLATEADLLVMVVRPIVAEVHHLTSRLTTIDGHSASVLLIGDRPYSADEVAGVVGASPLGSLPDDERGAAPLSVGHPDGLRVLRRSQLLRSARALAENLTAWLGPVAAAEADQLALPPGNPVEIPDGRALPPAPMDASQLDTPTAQPVPRLTTPAAAAPPAARLPAAPAPAAPPAPSGTPPAESRPSEPSPAAPGTAPPASPPPPVRSTGPSHAPRQQPPPPPPPPPPPAQPDSPSHGAPDAPTGPSQRPRAPYPPPPPPPPPSPEPGSSRPTRRMPAAPPPPPPPPQQEASPRRTASPRPDAYRPRRSNEPSDDTNPRTASPRPDAYRPRRGNEPSSDTNPEPAPRDRRSGKTPHEWPGRDPVAPAVKRNGQEQHQ